MIRLQPAENAGEKENKIYESGTKCKRTSDAGKDGTRN